VNISFTVCLCVCTVTDFSAEDKANSVKFCKVVHRHLMKLIYQSLSEIKYFLMNLHINMIISENRHSVM